MGDAAAVVAGELGVGAAGPELARRLVAAVAAVVVVVAAVVVRHAAAVSAGEHRGLAGVERCRPIGRKEREGVDTGRVWMKGVVGC